MNEAPEAKKVKRFEDLIDIIQYNNETYVDRTSEVLWKLAEEFVNDLEQKIESLLKLGRPIGVTIKGSWIPIGHVEMSTEERKELLEFIMQGFKFSLHMYNVSWETNHGAPGELEVSMRMIITMIDPRQKTKKN